jgi:uncharacterized damage-inducible protein DinB
MDIATLQFLAEYNQKTNLAMNGFIRVLSDAQWRRKFGGYFDSAQSLCNHLYICDFNWLKRFSKLRNFATMQETFFAREMAFGSLVIGSTQDYLEKRAILDHYILAFAAELLPDDLQRNLTYTDSHGKIYNRLFGGLILHMFNHQTHHRGMISLYLEEMQIANDFANLMDLL